MLLIGSGLRLIYILQQGQRQIQGRSVSQSGRRLVHGKKRRRYNSPAMATRRSVVIVRRRFYCIHVSMSSPASSSERQIVSNLSIRSFVGVLVSPFAESSTVSSYLKDKIGQRVLIYIF